MCQVLSLGSLTAMFSVTEWRRYYHYSQGAPGRGEMQKGRGGTGID